MMNGNIRTTMPTPVEPWDPANDRVLFVRVEEASVATVTAMGAFSWRASNSPDRPPEEQAARESQRPRHGPRRGRAGAWRRQRGAHLRGLLECVEDRRVPPPIDSGVEAGADATAAAAADAAGDAGGDAASDATTDAAADGG
jgi:hypothetical protein